MQAQKTIIDTILASIREKAGALEDGYDPEP